MTDDKSRREAKAKETCLNIRHLGGRTRCPKAMSKVITHPLLVRPSTATRGLIGVVPNQIAAAYNASSCQLRMSNVDSAEEPIFCKVLIGRSRQRLVSLQVKDE